jgi:hypothetical protein
MRFPVCPYLLLLHPILFAEHEITTDTDHINAHEYETVGVAASQRRRFTELAEFQRAFGDAIDASTRAVREQERTI